MNHELLSSALAIASAMGHTVEIEYPKTPRFDASLFDNDAYFHGFKDEPESFYDFKNENIQWERDMRQGKQFAPVKLPKYGPKPPRRNNQRYRERRD